jgi:hypothetical protein
MNNLSSEISPKIAALSDDELLKELGAYKLPKMKDLVRTLKHLKKTIGNEYRSSWREDESSPSMDITVGARASGEWDIQTGDNSFHGNAYRYPIWATTTLHRRSNTVELACDIRNQLSEAFAMQAL